MKQLHAEQNSPLVGKNLVLEFDSKAHCVWAQMQHPERPCMTAGLLKEVKQAQREIEQRAVAGHESGDPERLRYQILASSVPGVFALGGDLASFVQMIRHGQRAELYAYAKACIDVLYPSATAYGLPFTTIALVQGEALGGGFEAALSARVIVAEKGATFGFPETLFGLFPGMGAFSFLVRRLSPAMAKRLITSGKVYTATELYDLGVVDVLAEDGQGREAVYQYMQHQSSRASGFLAMDQVMDQFNPISYQELIDVVERWVDTAMVLSDKNLRMMEFLVHAQRRRWVKDEPEPPQGARLALVG